MNKMFCDFCGKEIHSGGKIFEYNPPKVHFGECPFGDSGYRVEYVLCKGCWNEMRKTEKRLREKKLRNGA